ncbi:hypothetical protein Q5W88_21700 [Shouchella clausii]|uniref:hypothetical protein n=1 Tax=Shouchella clausii TaxID=79880 RepID=UPI0026F4163F|nr:hypothetical protein [Shouchella clausii]MDO7285922.1 hypothetical protein [Shouchella clausii]MDO7305825.1 hypothetical protein [Shouchella clausii]
MNEYDLFLKKLLKVVKKKGILVKRMKVEDDFHFNYFNKPTEYRKCLGAVPVKGFFGNLKSVYLVYGG